MPATSPIAQPVGQWLVAAIASPLNSERSGD
jgi:hypothetical protein